MRDTQLKPTISTAENLADAQFKPTSINYQGRETQQKTLKYSDWQTSKSIPQVWRAENAKRKSQIFQIERCPIQNKEIYKFQEQKTLNFFDWERPNSTHKFHEQKNSSNKSQNHPSKQKTTEKNTGNRANRLWRAPHSKTHNADRLLTERGGLLAFNKRGI